MTEPMPEAWIRIAAEAGWKIGERDRQFWLDYSVAAITAAAPLIRADERAKALARVDALATVWEGAVDLMNPEGVRTIHWAARQLRAAIAQAEDQS